MSIDLEDASLLLERARKHFSEFGALTSPGPKGILWSYENEEIQAGLFTHRIRLHSDALKHLKPVVGDIANNVRHSLDQVAAAIARTELTSTELENARRSIRFPFPADDGSVDFCLSSQLSSLGFSAKEVFEGVWERHRYYEYYLRVVRTISNNSKHWQLEFVNAETLAAWLLPNRPGSKAVSIPKGHFLENDFFEWEDGPAQACRMMVQLQFNDIQPRPEINPMPPNPESVFNYSIEFAAALISALKV